jgi:transcriptional regulator with XRE-family HTH domain
MQESENYFVCQRLRSERQRLGLKQEEVGSICETVVQTVRRWEKNVPIPSDKLARLIPHGFDGQFILSGVASANLDALSRPDDPAAVRQRRALELFARLAPSQQDAFVHFLDTLLSGERR